MNFTKVFDIVQDESQLSNDRYISYHQFSTFLKDISKKNFRRTLQSYPGGISVINGKEVIPVKSALRYCFNQEKSESCAIVCDSVQQEILKSNDTEKCIVSSLDIYRLIAKTKFYSIDIDRVQNNETSDNDIPSLITEHRRNFTDDEWLKIVWFELHFSKNRDFIENSYDDIVKLKYEKFQSLLSIKECCDNLRNIISLDVKSRQERIFKADELCKPELHAREKHLAHRLDADILSLVQNYCGEEVKAAVTFDTVNSKTHNIFQLAIAINTANLQHDLSDLSRNIYYHVAKRHNVHIECIHITNENGLDAFIGGSNPARFTLRDTIESQCLAGIVYKWTNDEELTDFFHELHESGKCQSCYGATVVKPLSVNEFSVTSEWFNEVPIEVQLLLSIFINGNSLRLSGKKDVFLSQKLMKVHSVYDTLLNVYNKNYLGISQKANTNELLVEYKNINSVFDITSAAGTTSSLRHAEQRLEQMANDDMCYFNTYLKEHPLSYWASNGIEKTDVSLRACHCILMFDNLVRWTFKRNQAREDCRNNQICTLPITIQGLPLDSAITNEWHGENCDGSEDCHCKQSIILGKNDIKRTLLELGPEEAVAHEQFSSYMTWACSVLWKNISDEILTHIEEDGQPLYHNIVKDVHNTQKMVEDDVLPEPVNEDEIDLRDILTTIDNTETLQSEDSEVSGEEHDIGILNEANNINDSFANVSLSENYNGDNDLTILENTDDQLHVSQASEVIDEVVDIPYLLGCFGFSKFNVPPMICRHPPPAIGKDDDILKIREILDDVLLKLGYTNGNVCIANRILCGPDNKIGKCIIELMKSEDKYRVFLPEFPLLHLRKSKVTILFSAYQDAGLIQLMKFMKDDGEDDWRKLVSIQHIDMATQQIRRIAISLHLAFLVVFLKSLNREDQEVLLTDMETDGPYKLADKWMDKFNLFMDKSTKHNATFALHRDIMKHCDNVVEIAFAERLGGPTGYALLLASVKESIRFSFVNNASSYAPYCANLLYHHYSSGFYHSRLKQTLFSTHFKGSDKNFASDTKREIDHIEALKGFRSGSNVKSVTNRMSLVDSLNESRQRNLDDRQEEDNRRSFDNLGMKLTKIDESYIFPTAALIIRQGGLTTEENDIPFNVYSEPPVVLPKSILDRESNDTGEYLLMRYLVKERMYNLSQSDLPTAENLKGPSELVSRARRSKGTTIKRTLKSKIVSVRSEREIKEAKRLKAVSREVKLIDCLSSNNNACQAIVKPDSSKPKVMKSIGIPRALKAILADCGDDGKSIIQGQSHIPEEISRSAAVCAIEFAGVKFRLGNITSGKDYIKHVENKVKGLLQQMKSLQTIVICEEKYTFTPDEFKAGTRSQRKMKAGNSVDHLKTASSIMSDLTLNKDAVTKTSQGKIAIGNYLASNVHKLQFENNFNLIIDSELNKKACDCHPLCACQDYCTPITCYFKDGMPKIEWMDSVKQRKGEAEMAVLDWLVECQSSLIPGQAAVSIVSSGDIDAVHIHLHAISRLWNRDITGAFRNAVYVVLQKPGGKLDIYNITRMLSVVEHSYGASIGTLLSLGLCIGGNDFIPKLHLISHEKILRLLLSTPSLRLNLLKEGDHGNLVINMECLVELYKMLYCPKKHSKQILSYVEIRALTIEKKEDNAGRGGYTTKDPRKWLPPESAIRRLGELVQLQIEYLQTAGMHGAESPNFMSSKVLKQNSSGEVEYDFGPDSHFDSLEELPSYKKDNRRNQKRQINSTPQKGMRRKRFVTSTPNTDEFAHNKYRCVSCEDWERQKNGLIPTTDVIPPQPEFVCFRKFREKRRLCGGPKTKASMSTPEKCCTKNKYGGFSKTGLNSKGKNKYTCTSCEDWRNQENTITTESPIIPKEEWGSWSECQTTCGQGTKVRYSVCANCDETYEPKVAHYPCIINYYCPVNGNWGQWEPWKPCSASCNGGVRRRDRKCDAPPPRHGGLDCEGMSEEIEPCNKQECPVDGNWGPWSRFSLCSQSCGRGVMTRTRDCNRPAPSGGGQPCRGVATNTRRCQHRKCPVHGGWSGWGSWSSCAVTCGTGTRKRTRDCNRPRPLFDGRPCDGADTETTVCTVGTPCPIHGGWSEWTSYGRCRTHKPCSHGHRLRSRVCNNPRPQHRGRLCRGKRIEREGCFDQESCPVDGGWCEYEDWTDCIATCIGESSTQTRLRACKCPPPKNQGKQCSGDYLETRTCEGILPCDEISVSVDIGR